MREYNMKKRKLNKLQKQILVIAMVCMVIVAANYVFSKKYPLDYKNEPFSQDVVNQIKKKIKPDKDILVSRIGYNNNKEKNFSVEFVVPKNNGKYEIWMAILNEDKAAIKESRQTGAYCLYYGSTTSEADISKLVTIDKAFESYGPLDANVKEIFDQVSDGTEGEYLQIESNYNVSDEWMLQRRWKADEKGKKVENDPIISNLKELQSNKDIKALSIKSGKLTESTLQNEVITGQTFYIYGREEGKSDEPYEVIETLKAIINVN